jgi:Protein of unknown function (DUF1553)/Protein of unknown function (DUF1549)/Planctomycete cytochrome C
MMGRIAVPLFLIALAFSVPVRAADKPDRKGLDFFERKIRPVLVKQCYECHSAKAKKVRGKLLLDTRDGIRKGGESGPAVVPGKPERGTLLSALKHKDFEMPPSGKLPDAVIADFEKWIKLGAPDPRTGKANVVTKKSYDYKQARQFWSLRPLMKPAPPQVPGLTKDDSPIDRFIRAKLQANGLRPAAPAGKRTLIRRLYFDLIGLPPKPADIDRFLQDDSPKAVERLVDRLLASKHFGERWGRHWLDVARFAESSGGGRTAVYHLAWRYRDYVIRAYNEDRPFDQFVKGQIAGDLLPYKSAKQRRDQLTGTGFLLLGPTNYELQDKELLRMEVVDEQIDTMGRAFLGMTIGCARCHDHKFDPIPNEDYYALAGIFRGTHVLTPGNVSGYLKRPLPVSDEQARQLAAYEKKSNPLKDELAQLTEDVKRLRRQRSGLSVRTPGSRRTRGSVAAKSLPGIVIDDEDAKLTGNWPRSSSIKPYVDEGYRYSAGGKSTARFAATVPKTGSYEVRISYSAHRNRAALASVTVQHAGGTTTKRIDQRKPGPIDGLFLSLGTFRFEAGKAGAVEFTSFNSHGTVIVDAVQFLTVEQAKTKGNGKRDAKRQASLNTSGRKGNALDARISAADQRIAELKKSLKSLQKTAPPPAPLAMAVQDFNDAADYFVCVRGNVHTLGQKVPRGFLRVIQNHPANIPKAASGRLQLANWIANRNNPLTARVYVNRIWHHLFGTGIVRTVDNFGTMGERPSHPELLDWLAATFIEDGWSTKKLIRRIVMSQTYRQSGHVGQAFQPDRNGPRTSPRRATPGQAGKPDLRSPDPENRLLAHQNRRRLDAEAIRDAILAVSGQLDLTVGGPVIAEKVKSEFGYKHDSLRRSVYVPGFRNTMHPLLAVFDLADPNLVTGRRNVSTLPTQALYLMNSPFVMSQSRHAADRLLKENLPDAAARLDRAYERALGRPPTKAERELTLKYLQNAGTTSQQTAWATLFQALFGSIDFRYIE